MMVVFFGSAWMLVLWMIFWVVFTNYYLDLLIITNLRLIDVEQLALFSRDVTSAPLANLEDVKIEVKGILATLIGYGNLHIQTAAAEKEVVMRGVKNPTEVKEMIMRLHHEAVRGNLDKGR